MCEQHSGVGRTQRTSATREKRMADFESIMTPEAEAVHGRVADKLGGH